MFTKRTDFNKCCLFILSGVSNPLGKTLSIEMSRRFRSGSVILLIDDSEENVQQIKKDIESLEKSLQVICCVLDDWKKADITMFSNFLATTLTNVASTNCFDFALIVHNEGTGATHQLIEPEDVNAWKTFVHVNLYAAVALNQAFLQCAQLASVEKLCVNITSSLQVKPFVHSKLMCSCKQARGMYFRAMADAEAANKVSVLSYLPGIFETHQPTADMNNNLIDLFDLNVNEKLLEMPRVHPIESTLKLINILEEMSFISGHDVDYYDTFVI